MAAEIEEERWLMTAGTWPTPKIISGFLTPPRRSHPHVEPLLAPLWNSWQASWGLCLSRDLQGMHLPWRHIILEVSLCFALYKSPLLVPLPKTCVTPCTPANVPFPLSVKVFLFPSISPYQPSNFPNIPLYILPLLLFDLNSPLPLYRYLPLV